MICSLIKRERERQGPLSPGPLTQIALRLYKIYATARCTHHYWLLPFSIQLYETDIFFTSLRRVTYGQFHMIPRNLHFAARFAARSRQGVPLSTTYRGAGEHRVFCGFHDHLVGRTPDALLCLVLLKLLAEARHCRLRTVLGVGGIRPIVHMTGGHGKPDHTGGWFWGRSGQPVHPIGWRHLLKGIPH